MVPWSLIAVVRLPTAVFPVVAFLLALRMSVMSCCRAAFAASLSIPLVLTAVV